MAMIAVRWLKNGFVQVRSRTEGGQWAKRNEPPSGTLSVDEAAAALKTSDMRIYRMMERGDLVPRRFKRGRRLLVADLRALRAKVAA